MSPQLRHKGDVLAFNFTDLKISINKVPSLGSQRVQCREAALEGALSHQLHAPAFEQDEPPADCKRSPVNQLRLNPELFITTNVSCGIEKRTGFEEPQ